MWLFVDPREVKDLDATAEEGKCTEPTLRVKWNTLRGRDRRGVIQNYTLLFRVSHPRVPGIIQVAHHSDNLTIQVTLPFRSPHHSGHPIIQITSPFRSPYHSDHLTIQVTLPFRSSHYSGHPTIQIISPFRSPYHSDPLTIQITLPFRSSYHSGHPTF